MRTTVIVCDVCGKKNRVPVAAAGHPACGNCHSPLPWIVDATDDDFGEVADAATVPVLVDLWAPWCGPCRFVSPALEKLAHDNAGRIKLVKVDVDQAPQTSRRFDVMGIPTLVLLHRGQVIERQTGAAPENALREWLDKALAKIGAGSS